ncbi:unnamed protein product [Absidia cylindrospora]
MSVNRPRSLSRQNTPRALTLPTTYDNSHMHCSTTSLNAAGVSELSTYLPSTDESLQDWLTRNLPEANSPSPLCSLMNEACPCCKKYDCENMEALHKTMKRLESDACLAAQIGQSLLQKHESLVAETNQTKGILEQQLNEFREKVANLEILLVDADNSKQETEEERDRYHWKWQKSQKALEETSIDLEKANKRCIEIGQELQNKTKELEKLRIFKFMVRQADFREDMLRSQLEDTNQELAISRKNELMLESKYKKLKSRYETVCTTCENLRMDGQTTTTNNNNNNNGSNSRRMDYLLESNEQLQNNIIKLTSMLSDQSSLSTSPPSEQGYLITLIKELTLANAKLKMDLLDGNLLAFEEHLDGPMGVDNEESVENSFPCESDSPPNYGTQLLTTINSNDEKSHIPSTPPQMTSLLSNQGLEQDTVAVNRTIDVNENAIPTNAPSPTTSSSLPTSSKHGAVHYHYHYSSHKAKRPLSTMFRRSYNILNKDEQTISNLNFESPNIPKVTLSPTSNEDESTTHRSNDANPYDQLEKHASLVYDRLKSTDIRSLNRRLKRAFDIMELSSMSNSIIDNILNDILLLEGQFLWVKTGNDNNISDNNNDISVRHHPTSAYIFSAFFPTLALLQNMLTEIGELRMTMNDLQLEYVKKVEEMDQLAERDVLRKRQENEKAAALASDHQNSRSSHGGGGRAALAWLSNVFHLQTPSSASTSATKTMTTSTTVTTDSMQRSIRYQRSFDSMFTATRDGMMTHNNSRPLVTTTSSSLRIKQKKHDFDCFGPSSSLPRSASMNEQKRRKRSGSSQPKQYGHPLRPSVSAGPVRKSVASPGVWSSSAPPPPPSSSPPTPPSLSSLPPGDIKTVQRKRSLLGLGSGFKEPLDKLDSSSSNSSDWKLGTSFGGSWLGT